MKRFIPVPGDLIIVEFSEWYALNDGEKLRVCENCEWMDIGEEIYVAPRHQVKTFWGPDFGQPDGRKPERMSTSGGPFKTIKIKELDGIELIGTEEDLMKLGQKVLDQFARFWRTSNSTRFNARSTVYG